MNLYENQRKYVKPFLAVVPYLISIYWNIIQKPSTNMSEETKFEIKYA